MFGDTNFSCNVDKSISFVKWIKVQSIRALETWVDQFTGKLEVSRSCLGPSKIKVLQIYSKQNAHPKSRLIQHTKAIRTSISRHRNCSDIKECLRNLEKLRMKIKTYQSMAVKWSAPESLKICLSEAIKPLYASSVCLTFVESLEQKGRRSR